MSETAGILVVTTLSTAALHTLIPDHWLPFVLVARSERWGGRRTALLTGLAAALHVGVSLALALAAHYLARGAEEVVGIGESFATLSSLFLVAFGVAYALWFLVKGGHQHSFGMHPHHAPEPGHRAGGAHPHDLPPAGRSAEERVGVGPGSGASAVPGHARSRGLALAAIVGFNPCVLVIPLIHQAGTMGLRELALVAGAFAVSTVTCMVGIALLGLHGTARLESPFLIRYGEAVSGGVIALTGLLVLFVGH